MRIVIGNVRITRIGLTKKSSRLNTTATSTAVPYVFIDTPGIRFANPYAIAATTNMRMIIFINQISD